MHCMFCSLSQQLFNLLQVPEAREAGVEDPSYLDAKPTYVVVVVFDRVYPFYYISQHLCWEWEHNQSHLC